MAMTDIIPEIVSQHAEEAAYLWFLRQAAAGQPHYSLDELAQLDDRVEAHLDGLRIAGDAGWEITREVLPLKEAGEVFAAAVIALDSGVDERYELVLDAACQSEEQARGFASALGWLPYAKAKASIDRLIGAPLGTMRRIGIAASAIHREDPRQALTAGVSDSDPLLRRRALKAVGELGRTDLLGAVLRETKSDDAACRFWAAWAAALLGDYQGRRLLRDIAESDSPFADRASVLALRMLHSSESHAWQRALASQPAQLRLAVIGAGAIGDPVHVPWLIDRMETPAVARVAGEALTMITGLDLVDENMEGEWPEGFEAGPTEDPEDENVEMDPDEDLPWPQPEKVRSWWDKRRTEFWDGSRYLCGKPIDEAACRDVLRSGLQRQRRAAALELALMHPNAPLFNTSAPGFRQQRFLSAS